jgi:predicted GNAT family N-acyltransferase
MAHPQKKQTSNTEISTDRSGKQRLDELDPARIATQLVMFEPSEEVIADLVAKARLSIPGLAPASEAIKVQRHNSACLMALARKSKFDPAAPTGEGFIAMLPLNGLGMELLALDALEATKPNLKFLSRPGERPEGIYLWAIFAPGLGAASMALFMEKLTSEQYAGLDIYARAVTAEGRNFLKTMGFAEGTEIGPTHAPHLWKFPRRLQAPLYDSYVPNSGKKDIGVTIARTLDDLMRVAAIRNAVYVGEQECPYNEEYDGNDLAATHLLAYMGDEPIGCLRVRLFADFVKFERMAIRKEYRKSRAAILLAQAGLRFARKKGYRRAYAHSQVRLVDFWSRFGFRPLEGANTFVFSDFDYVEIVADLEPDPDAVVIGTSPYVLIRPEGRWHVPGVLETSAARPASNPSIVKKR